jgi:hypothetical protein
MRLQNGDIIRVRTYGGQVVSRRVVDVRKRVVLISTEDECKKAAIEKREPICLGFPIADVVEVERRK